MYNLLSVDDFTDNDVIGILDEARRYKLNPRRHDLRNYTMTCIFMESSTRTTLSFQKAMQNLGGHVLMLDMNTSSRKKGESLSDTLRTAGVLSDVIVLRQPDVLVRHSIDPGVPVINAGDGSGEHPTQALLDLYTIRESIGRITDLDVVFVGDNENSRTVRSLARLLGRFKGNRLVFIEPSEDGRDVLEEIIHTADVIYMTRHQKERHRDGTNDFHIIRMDERLMKKMNANAILMHPLPRNTELPEALDRDERAVYFEQVRNGVFVRMAILVHVLLHQQKN